MEKVPPEIDWYQLSKPLSSDLFDKYTHQSFLPPLYSLNINEILWNECRSFALKLGQNGFIDPLSILYTSFKRFYPNCSSIRSFSRWLSLHEKENQDFKNYFKQYSIHSMNIQSTGELLRLINTLDIPKPIPKLTENFDQIWFLFSISIRIPINDYAIIADTLILDDGVTRLSIKQRKTTSCRIHCLFALTPSGKFSNQLIICKQGKHLKMNFQSSPFTRIIQTLTGDITYEHIHQWFEDFISLSYGKNHSAILIDPRTTLLTPEMENLCQKSNFKLITIDLNYYLIHILSPIFTLFDKKCSEVNRLDKMFLKSASDLKRIIFTIWCSLRTLKQNEQICQLFQQSFLWTNEDELYRQSLRLPISSSLPKKKKKKSPVKTGNKVKLSSSTIMIDPPSESTPEEILSYVIQRQISISRASKFLGGMKLDYLKYCLSYKSNSSLMTGTRLMQLNTFMQSQSTIDWLRCLRSLYYWPCAKQLFLREIYQLTGIITRKRTMNNTCGNGHLGSIRSCDLQSPGIFWRAFEDIHQIQFDNESIIDDDQWNDDFQQYLIDKKLNHEKTQLWTIDTFEFPLIKKSSVLQLPEWNELRPMNLTPKVTVIYAFSNTGQFIEPYFIFPNSFHDHTIIDEENSYNELGHLTPQIFLYWIENYLRKKIISPIVLIFCSRLPILSPFVLSSLENYQIYPYGYPYTRTLPFRYLFERRVRNNRSTNLISELWKKKLLDEQRTHVLKGSNCTVKTIKYYFEQIWLQIIHEKRDEEDNKDEEQQQTFEDKCQQAFQQANIQIKKLTIKKKTTIKLTPKKNSKKSNTINNNEILDQLYDLLAIVSHYKEQIASANPSQILKMNNHIEQSTDSQPSNETMDDTENVHLPSTSSSESVHSPDPIVSLTNDKRSIDENDQPHISKRLRSSCSQASTNQNTTTTTTIVKWIPPSKQLVTRLQSQSSSVFQFTLSLVNLILSSTDNHLTDEHSSWLYSTINSFDHDYNHDKIHLIIETAYKVAKISLIR